MPLNTGYGNKKIEKNQPFQLTSEQVKSINSGGKYPANPLPTQSLRSVSKVKAKADRINTYKVKNKKKLKVDKTLKSKIVNLMKKFSK